MQLFYISGFIGDACKLNEEESRHCIKVLRLRSGDAIHLTDGKGKFYRGRLTDTHLKGCQVQIVGCDLVPRVNPWKIHIAMALTKNIERFEWFLEKATEIGFNEITPLICEHSERTIVKISRLEKVLVSAMKQSLKAWLPKVNEPQNFDQFIEPGFEGQKFIAWCETGLASELHTLYRPGSDALVLIGPEGDFSAREVDVAKKAGFVTVSLGESRLRTETAGVVACHTIDLINRVKGVS
ncbi:MAG: 16S rRNA (uracil(1498)-N(3))-methyltransferase [Bacteroidota bacterium]